MNNDAYEDDEKLPDLGLGGKREKQKRSVFHGLFTWREILEGFIGKHPKSIHLGTLIVISCAYHAYFFYCLYRYHKFY